MKKLYTTLALAAAVAISASAADFTLRENITERKNISATPSEKLTIKKTGVTTAISAKKAAASRADASESIEGEWDFILGDYYNGEQSAGPFYATITATVSEGMVIFEDPTSKILPFAAVYDETTGVLTFTKVLLAPIQTSDGKTYFCRQEPFVWDDTDKFVYQDITATYDAVNRTITFEELRGIRWLAYNDEACTDFVGNFLTLDIISAARPISWKAMGQATFLCHFMGSVFINGYNPATATAYTVDILYDEDKPTTFLIKDPWKQVYASNNWNGMSPDFTIQTADRSNVVVPLVPTGISSQTDGDYGILSSSYYSELTGEPTPDDETITMTVNNENVATITFKPKSILIYATATDKFYYTTEATSTLTFTLPSDIEGSINSVAADSNADAPVEYFNLQGVRVANPAAGQLVIKRQGDSVSKIVIR